MLEVFFIMIRMENEVIRDEKSINCWGIESGSDEY